jgi:dihydrofolate reductase
LKQNEGKDIWLVGGGQINQLFLNANLIDEMIISIQPVVLGEGLPLFGNGTNFKRFRVDTARNYNGTMAQVYLVRK